MDTSIQNKLLPGEEILWEGQPKTTPGFNWGKAGVSMFGIIWLGFSLFWTLSAFLMTRSAADGFFSILFPMFGLPFVAIGVYMVFFLPFKNKKQQNRTFYYVTNKRIINNLDTQSAALSSIFIKDLRDVRLIENRDNTGNIMFGPFRFNSKNTDNTNYVLPAYDNCFYRIENAADVHTLILMHMELSDLKENI